MKLTRSGGVALLAAAGLALTACGSSDESANPPSTGGGGSTTSSSGAPAAGGDIKCEQGSIMASGSSAQKNAMAVWVKAYQEKCNGATINYQSVGSGAGRTAFLQNQTAFAGSDAALKPEEATMAMARCQSNPAINLPMVGGPIALAYNLDGVKDLKLKPDVIAKIFSGEIKQWDDAAIKADNGDAKLPSAAIQVFTRSDSSGTTENFTRFLEATAKDSWTFGSGGDWKAPGSQGAKGSEGITQGVQQGQGAIGYVEQSFAKNAELSTAKVANGSGEFVELTPDAVAANIAAAEVVGEGGDLSLKLNYASDAKGSYPILLVTYEIVCTKGNDPASLPLLKSFMNYIVSDAGQEQLSKNDYAPLPKELQTKVKTAIESLA